VGLGLGGLGVYWSYRVVYERALDFKRGLDQRSFWKLIQFIIQHNSFLCTKYILLMKGCFARVFIHFIDLGMAKVSSSVLVVAPPALLYLVSYSYLMLYSSWQD